MAKADQIHSRQALIIALKRKRNVMSAVMLRDMRTRFFNHGLGFIIVPLWPLVHMGALLLIHLGGSPPYGQSNALFYATGLLPTLTFIYVTRFMGLSLLVNRAMLSFPEVHIIDVMFGRAFLEIIAACIMLFLTIVLLWVTGQDPFPVNLESAVCCYLATIFLSLGVGTFVGVISLYQPMVITGYALVVILLYLSSGTLFVASALPDPIANALAYNPLVVCVEWMRTAFYESYSDKLVDAQYVMAWGLSTMMLGLAIERFFRRQLLEA